MDKLTNNLTLKLLICKTAGQLYAIDLGNIIRALHMVTLQHVPGMAEYFKGMLNLHGEHIPIIDLAGRLDIKNTNDYHLNTPILLLKVGDLRGGLIADELIGVVEVNSETDLQGENIHNTNPLLAGFYNTQYGPCLLLDSSKLIVKHGQHQ